MRQMRWFGLFLIAVLFAPSAAGAEQVKLRVTLQVAVTNFLGVNLMQFKEEVEKRSDKAIAIEIFDKGQLYIDDQVVDAVATGAIEMGVGGFNQFVKKIPAVNIIQQPFLFNFEALARSAASPESDVRKLIDEAILSSIGVRVLWWQSFGSSVFVSKGQDVSEPSRLSNQKVRVFSTTMAEFTKYCGGTPLVLSSSKMHDAMKDGVVDMIMTGVSAVETRQLWKVADTVTRTEHAVLEFFVIINEKTWQTLNENHKAIISEAARKVERDLRERISKIEADAYVFARDKGMKIYDLTPDQVAEWRACSAGVLDAYMSNSGDLVRQILAAYGKLRTDPCCSVGPKGSFNRR